MSEKGSKGLREMTTGLCIGRFPDANSGNDRADRSWGRNDDRFFSSVVCNDRILYVYGI